jgi:DNA-binding IclR family transcriptional regulator
VTDDSVSGVDTDERASNLLTSTQKALGLLETMASMGRPAGVSELARLVGSSRGTVHKQLSTLVASGWVEQHEDGRYGLSLLVARIGNAALRQAGLGEKLQQVLEGVVAETGECATIAALHRHSSLIMQRAESDQVLNANIRAGTVIPLTAGASSLVLLAFATTPEQRKAWRGAGVEMASESRIAAVREAGYAITRDEFLDGVTAVSLPLRDEFTLTTSALTMVGPKDRVDVDQARRVLEAARDQIQALGRPKDSDTSVA